MVMFFTKKVSKTRYCRACGAKAELVHVSREVRQFGRTSFRMTFRCYRGHKFNVYRNGVRQLINQTRNALYFA